MIGEHENYMRLTDRRGAKEKQATATPALLFP